MNSVIVPGPPPPMPVPTPPVPLWPNFNGQWVGALGGETPGLGVVELESEGGWVSGTAYLYPYDQTIVPAAIRLGFPATFGPHQFNNLPVTAFAPDLGQSINRQQMNSLYPLSDVAETATATLTIMADSVFVMFQSPKTSGWGSLARAHSQSSGLVPFFVPTWAGFRTWLHDWEGRQSFVFRGQGDSAWPLRTSFHRSNKKNLEQYTSTSVPEAYQALANKLTDKLDLSKRADLWTFMSHLQHHGYPTPLLDWTESAWVAAYFAFENAPVRPDGLVRIYAFDRAGWQAMLQQEELTMTRPHLSFLKNIVARGNDRAGPQKSIFTVTNVDDIEAHIIATEQRHNRRFLFAIDIPNSARRQALAGLDDIGYNRGVLFPDADGICRTMKSKHFGID